MIVPLLVSAVHVEANNIAKLSFVPSEEESKAAIRSRRRNDALFEENENSVRDVDPDFVEIDRSDDLYASDREKRSPRGSVNTAENRYPRSGSGGLAHKMAKDALKSPKVQATIDKLSHMPSHKGKGRGKGSRVSKSSNVKAGNDKGHQGSRGKGRHAKKKRNRHHRRLSKQYPGMVRGGSSKRTSASKRDTSVSRLALKKRRKALIKHNNNRPTFDDMSRVKYSSSGSIDRSTVVRVDDGEYVDFSTSMGENSGIGPESLKHDGTTRSYGNENMIARLMKTTTRDPSKKLPGDQGIEYSDYYSNDEVLQDIAANKIPMLIEPRRSNDRDVRHIKGDRHRIHRTNRYNRDYDPRRKELRYGDYSVDPLNDLQNSPTIDRAPSLSENSRLTDAEDPSQNYPGSDQSLEYRPENSDAPYPLVNTLETTQPMENVNEPRDNFQEIEADKLDGETRSQSSVDAQSSDGYKSFEQNENSQEENANETLEPRVPESLQNADEYRSPESVSRPVENFDASYQVSVGDIKISTAKEEPGPVTQSNYASVQLNGNFPMQAMHNSSVTGLQNAMDQPLGKVLESLGIDINGAAGNVYEKSNPNDRVNHPVLPFNVIDRPREPGRNVLSPSYLKKQSQANTLNYYEIPGYAKGSDYQVAGSRNSGRQSLQDQADNNIALDVDGDKKSAQDRNISIAVQDTKEVAGQILDTIMDELEEMKYDRSKSNKREGCWSTAQAGMKLEMRVVNRTVIVTASGVTTPRFRESLLNGTWNISGHAPLKRGSPFTLMATDNNTDSMAVFIGACRVCQGVDTIAGVWSVTKRPKDCRDFHVSTSVFNDIFRKSKLSRLKEEHGTTTTEGTTLKHEKRKS